MDAAVPPSNQIPASSSEDSNVFFINIQDKSDLFHIYMPFIINGGLFVKTDKQFKLGNEIFLLIKLIDEPEKYSIRGKVRWITPPCAQGARVAGVGVQFGGDASELRAKIEMYLAGALAADKATDTM